MVSRPAPFAPEVTSAFPDHLAAHGDRLAVVGSEGDLTYAGLERLVAAMADRLGPERRLVAVEAGNAVGPLVAYLAALRGRHPVPPPAAGRRPAPRGHDRGLRPRCGDGRRRRLGAGLLRPPGSAHELHPDLALMLSTSGSTGSAKVVRLSRENLQANADAITAYLGLSPA